MTPVNGNNMKEGTGISNTSENSECVLQMKVWL